MTEIFTNMDFIPMKPQQKVKYTLALFFLTKIIFTYMEQILDGLIFKLSHRHAYLSVILLSPSSFLLIFYRKYIFLSPETLSAEISNIV